MSDYTLYIEQIARAALGEPNGKLSSRRELRFGTHGSKSVVLQGDKAGAYYDHENGTGGGPVELVRDALGLDFNEAMKWLERETGIERQSGNGAYVEPVVLKKSNGSAPIETVYPYRDGDSVIRYEIVRKPNHEFVGRHTDENGKTIWKLKGVERLPYRLPELMIRCAESIFIAEGEKDVDRLVANGLLATCNSFGAGKWGSELNQHFIGRDIFILPDNDDTGRSHAEKVRAELAPVANKVTIVELEGLPDKGDVSDWFDVDGNDAEKLLTLVMRAEATARGPFSLRAVGVLAPRKRAPRAFVVPFRMMRGHITLTAAAPGVGKSTLAVEEAISLVTGEDFLNLDITEKRRVGLINNEETRDEIERRIEATCQAFKIQFTDIADRLFIHSGVDDEKFVISRDVGGEIVHTPHKQMLREFVGDLDLDVVIVDPFVQSHAVSESSNEAISQVMVGLRDTLTAGQGAALHLIHHNRKPMAGNSHQAGDLYAARGASAMQGEAHFVFTLADMDAESQRQFGIDDDKKGFYVRLDDAKSKMAPPAGAKWFERHGEALRRSDGNLEQIGILRPWLPPDFRLDITEKQRVEILRYVNECWMRERPLAQQARGRKFAEMVPNKFDFITKQHARYLLDEWFREGIVANEKMSGKGNVHGLRVIKPDLLKTLF